MYVKASVCVIDAQTPSSKTAGAAVIHTAVANIAPEWTAAYAKVGTSASEAVQAQTAN